jgi:type I restriction enzyme R subunit
MFALLGKGNSGEELMKSTNFEFLRPSFPELADLGGFAERYTYSDPSSALVKLRMFGNQDGRTIHLASTPRLSGRTLK